jgi:hypothetical protein
MSYKLVDQIKKSPLPRPLKTALEAYATFGNKDGTSVRPTEAHVAKRASASRSTISRHAQTLVALGLLVHDRDEHGIFLKYAYGENGTWAYVYHIDASKLSDPTLIARWEAEREAFIEKCRSAGDKNFKSRWVKGSSGNLSGLSKIQQQEQRDLRQTLPEGFATNPPEQNALVGAEGFATQTLPLTSSQTHPSAVSTAVIKNQVSKQVSEVRSVAPLPHAVSGFQENNCDQAEQGVAEAAVVGGATPTPTPQWSSKLGRMFDSGEWDICLELYTALVTDTDVYAKGFDNAEILALAEVNWDMQRRYSPKAMPMVYRDAVVDGYKGRMLTADNGTPMVTAEDFWKWNHLHKPDRMKFFTMQEMHKAWFSTNPRSGRKQWENHKGCKACMDKCPVCNGYEDCPCRPVPRSAAVVNPPVAPAPQPVVPEIPQRVKVGCAQCKGEFEVDRGLVNLDPRRPYPKVFCSEECKKAHAAHEEELRQKHVPPPKPEKYLGLAAFLNGGEY